MNTRLIEIGNDLSICYPAQTQRARWIEKLVQQIDERKVELTPAEGWPGTNDKQRDSYSKQTFASDVVLQEMVTELNKLKDANTTTSGDILALEAERRALEWSIRETLANALAGKRNGSGPVEEAAFDDAAQNVADEQNVAELEVPF